MQTTGQPQQVVVVQQPVQQPMVVQQPVVVQQPQTMGTAGGGEFNTTQQPQTVVVVQQQVPATATQQQVGGDRFPRWAYLIFGIGLGAYHFILFWWFAILSFAPGGYGTLFFFCGLVPSLVAFIWIINDSTVFCANPGNGPITKMCCCECINGYVMAVPMAIAAGLRLILWLALFGILADFLNDSGETSGAIDNVFWIIVSIGAFDVGPLILCAIDWWWYYGKFDYDALFGTEKTPLRCVTGESIVIMIVSWAFIGALEEITNEAAEIIWPWILHGIVSTAILVFAAFLQFSGSVQGNKLNNGFFKFVCWGLGIAQGILILIIWGYILSWAFGLGFFWFVSFILLIYGLYYSGMTVPTVWALFSFQVEESNGV